MRYTKNTIRPEEKAELDSIGFEWKLDQAGDSSQHVMKQTKEPKQKKYDAKWNDKFEELSRFASANGHFRGKTNALQTHPVNIHFGLRLTFVS